MKVGLHEGYVVSSWLFNLFKLPGSKECKVRTIQVLAHYAAVTDTPNSQAGRTSNIPS